MGRTTFSGPVRVGNKDGDELGELVLYQQYQFDESEMGSAIETDIVIPAGARIIDVFVDTPEAFNAADTLEIGDGSDADAIGDITALNAAARIVSTPDATQVAFNDALAAEVTVTITPSGSTSTAGIGILTIGYIKR